MNMDGSTCDKFKLKIVYIDKHGFSGKADSGQSSAKIRSFSFHNPTGAEKDVFSLVKIRCR
jgi:hypothetical protein